MKLLALFLSSFIISSSTMTILDDHHTHESKVYSGENDVVELLFTTSMDVALAVMKNPKNGEYEGVYRLDKLEGSPALHPKAKVTKIMENGKCFDEKRFAKYILIGATDGIYKYTTKPDEIVKYGNLTIDVTQIQISTKQDIVYIITNNGLNKVTENGTKIDLIETENDVEDIVLDSKDNLYVCEKAGEKYTVKVIKNDTVVDVKLPEFRKLQMGKLPETMEGAFLILDNRVYIVTKDGACRKTTFMYKNAPSAYFIESGVVSFLAQDKSIYLVDNIVSVLEGKPDGYAKLFFGIERDDEGIFED